MDLREYFARQSGREAAWMYARVIGGLLLLGALLFLGMSSFYRVDASEEGVVLRFGEHIDTVTPGLHWKLPWPIDTVYKVPVRRIQSLEFGFATRKAGRRTEFAPTTESQLVESEMLTGDLNLARVEWIVQYRIKNSYDYLFHMGRAEYVSPESLPSGERGDPNPAVPDTIRNVSESVMRELVGDRSVDAILTFGRTEIAAEAEQRIQDMLDQFQSGVQIETVKLQNTEPPSEVQDAFQEVNRAKQVKERMVNEAEGDRNRRVPAARGQKQLAISEAKGYREQIVGEATGRIDAFKARLAAYEQAPEVTRTRLYLEAMDEILTTVQHKTIIDESVKGLVPLLNLDRETTASPVTASTKKGGEG